MMKHCMSFFCGCGMLHDVKLDEYEYVRIVECLCGLGFRVTKKIILSVESLAKHEVDKIYDAKR